MKKLVTKASQSAISTTKKQCRSFCKEIPKELCLSLRFLREQWPFFLFSSIVDLCNSFDGSNTLRFSTVFYAYEGNASKYIEQCSYPSFISDWLLNKLERQKRLPESIHLTDFILIIIDHMRSSTTKRLPPPPIKPPLGCLTNRRLTNKFEPHHLQTCGCIRFHVVYCFF